MKISVSVRKRHEEKYCIRCGSRSNVHRHHVTYQPEEVVDICYKCHCLITTINAVVARMLGSSLSSEIRNTIWKAFMEVKQENWGLIQ